MQSHENLIQSAINENWINSLCFYYKAKKVFVNSCYYNYSIRSIAKKTGHSFNFCKEAIQTLQKKGLIRIHDNNIVFVSQEESRKLFKYKPNDKHLCTIKFTKETSIYEIKKILYSKVVELLARQQQNVIKQKLEVRLLNNPNAKLKLSDVKRIIKKRNNDKSLETALNNNINFSDNTLAIFLKCSLKMITDIKKYFVSNNIFTIKTDKPKRLLAISRKMFDSSIDILKEKFGQNIFYCYNSMFRCYNSCYIPTMWVTKNNIQQSSKH